MTTDDDLRAAGKEVQGKLWPATLTAPAGQFPAAKLAPEFFDYVQQTAFGMIWTRPGLDPYARRLLVLATTAALGRWEEFRLHLAAGMTRDLEWADVEEVLLQTAVYAGVPIGNTGFIIAAEERERRRLSANL